MHAVRMLLNDLEACIRELELKRAVSHDYHASVTLDYPEKLT